MFISYSLTDDVYNTSTLKDPVQQLHTAALSTDWFMWCLRLYQSFQSMEGYFNFSNGIGISHLAPHCLGHFKWASLCIQLRLLGTALLYTRTLPVGFSYSGSSCNDNFIYPYIIKGFSVYLDIMYCNTRLAAEVWEIILPHIYTSVLPIHRCISVCHIK